VTEATPNPTYFLTQEEYAKSFEPLYKQHLEPKTLIQFPIILPFCLPIPSESAISFIVNDNAICTYLFTVFSIKEPTTIGALDDKFVHVENTKTRVEMTYVTNQELEWKSEIDFSIYFDILVGVMNSLIASYLVTKKDTDAYRVSREMFQIASLCRFIRTDSWDKPEHAIFRLHSNAPYERDTLTQEQIDKIIWYAHVLLENLNPFILSEEMMMSARRTFKEGFYREAVIFAQTSVETVLSTLYVNLLIHEGKSPSDAEKIKEDISFMSMLKKEFHSRVGGKWNVEDKRTKAGIWYHNAYILRNKVAHGGYAPTFEEAKLAMDAAYEFRIYVIELIKKKERSIL
jgi:hypothetical protein